MQHYVLVQFDGGRIGLFEVVPGNSSEEKQFREVAVAPSPESLRAKLDDMRDALDLKVILDYAQIEDNLL